MIDPDLHDTPREDHFSTYNDLIIQPPYLPPEIITMILDKYYEAVFIPGEIQPDELVIEDGDYFAASTYFHRHLKAIARLNPKMYDEYKHRYWKENTLVKPLKRQLSNRPCQMLILIGPKKRGL